MPTLLCPNRAGDLGVNVARWQVSGVTVPQIMEPDALQGRPGYPPRPLMRNVDRRHHRPVCVPDNQISLG